MKTEENIKRQLKKLLEAKDVDFQSFLELTSDFISYDNKYLRFRTDAGAVAHLGRESIKDHTTAVIELVKNGYDADAEEIEIEIVIDEENSFIRIADSGTGMTRDEVINNWLRIGYSTKRIDKTTKKERRKTGEKGIGRLSADRLGSTISLTTKSKGSDVFGLKIDWDDFNKQGVDLLLIPFHKINNPQISIPKGKKEGTEIIITNLRNNWSDSDFKRLYEELSIFTSPFKVIKDFTVKIKTNIKTQYKGEVKPKEHLEPEVKLSVYFEGDKDEISYFISDKYGFSDGKKEKKIAWKLLTQKSIKKGEVRYFNDFKDFDVSSDVPSCGPVIFDLMFYPRESSLVKGTGFTLKQLKEYLEFNGGVKIYRDNVSVKPYGFSGKDGEDWLNLGERQAQNPAGIGRQDWMVKNNQMLGAVYISRDENSNLKDSAAREGLVHNEAYFDLRALLLGGVRLLELHRHNIHKKINKKKEGFSRLSHKKILDEYKLELAKLKDELANLKKEAEKNNHQYVLNASKNVDVILMKTDSTEKTIEEILDKNRTLGGLATIGISSAVFGHETQMSLTQFISANDEALQSLNENPPDIKEALNELEEARNHANHVSEWGAFALTRIKRDKRRRKKTDIKALLEKTIKEMSVPFDVRGIKFIEEYEEVEAKTFPMDIETILINLLTNSYSACIHNNEDRRIKLSLKNSNFEDKEGFEITVSDTGNGVHDEFREIIWEALYTTKTDNKGNETGTGLGLTIVQSIIEDLDGYRNVINDPELGGARFTIWLPKK